ncbi:GH25 family lysozyme [Limosilactobacillus vaginalis]|uniref:GH25 family lysozyme n=1 Tax=Limosilactobacillus vaginalis TaxID=1633 RepID=UPI0025A43AAE|nr:GH25 family lysozyme [Limosilactobacillus vaginalis]MDM8264597.1 GH25 family lysozyme [Limosilactobacillus vaginalis]
MALYTVDVYSGSSDSIIRDSHADGVIVKATQGTSYVNPRCNHQWDLAGQLGKLRGLYHYAGGGNPESEAKYFINNIKNYVGKAVLILDWESYQNASWGNTSWARRFVDEVHRLTGVWCLIYVQESALWQVANCAKDCGVWVAKYASMNWNSWTLPDMSVSSGAFACLTGWQFTGGDMDRSIFYLDANAWNKIASGDGTIANQVTNGFVQNNGQWQYFENNIAVKNSWRLVDKLWYYLDGSGNLESGWQKINNKWYFLNDQHDGTFGAAKTGWNQINNRWYYMDKENAWCLTGWQEIDGKKYYFDPENAWMLTGRQEIDGKLYAFGDDGAFQEAIANQPDYIQPAKDEATVKLSASDRQAIENDLKSYIQNTVKDEISKLKEG